MWQYRIAGYEWALQMAKMNLVKHYLVVGVTEEMEDFVAVLEATMPRFFTGALEIYRTGQLTYLRTIVLVVFQRRTYKSSTAVDS